MAGTMVNTVHGSMRLPIPVLPFYSRGITLRSRRRPCLGSGIAAATDGSNIVWRFAHNHNDGTSFYAQAFAQISNDGRWALFSSYWDGKLGGSAGDFSVSTRIDTFIVELT